MRSRFSIYRCGDLGDDRGRRGCGDRRVGGGKYRAIVSVGSSGQRGIVGIAGIAGIAGIEIGVMRRKRRRERTRRRTDRREGDREWCRSCHRRSVRLAIGKTPAPPLGSRSRTTATARFRPVPFRPVNRVTYPAYPTIATQGSHPHAPTKLRERWLVDVETNACTIDSGSNSSSCFVLHIEGFG